MRGNAPKIAIIGCGAIAELFYLPAFSKYPSVLEELVLVDSNKQRLQKLATDFGVKNYRVDYREVLREVDGAIIAVPHHLHYPISMDFLLVGVHVLCEKPIAESAVEVRKLVEQADKSAVTISVNNTRRLFPAYSKVKELLLDGVIGNLLSMSYQEGGAFKWPTASGFYFNSKMAPRGVLLDRGAHALDLICWWLGGKPNLISSQNDSWGGCEAVAHIRFEGNGCVGKVKLSWLYKLENRYVISGETGKIEGDIYNRNSLTITSEAGKEKKLKLKSTEKQFYDFGNRVVANLINVITRGEKPLISGVDVIDSIELIEECYHTASRFEMPWYQNLEIHDGK